jgi:hypothetical protein
MTTETKSITVIAYRDKDGNPCCANDFNAGGVCVFYRTHRFGCSETCVFAEVVPGKRSQTMERRGAYGLGTLIPLPQCPVWAGEPKQKSLPPEPPTSTV